MNRPLQRWICWPQMSCLTRAPRQRYLAAALGALTLVFASTAQAESPWRLGIAVGYGERSNPLVASDDLNVFVDLDVAWFGRRLYFDNGDLGWTLADGRRATVSLSARVNSDRVFFGRTNTQFVTLIGPNDVVAAPVPIEVPGRRYAVEAGIEVLADGDWGALQAAMHHDVSGTHDGFEVAATYAYGRRFGRWYVEPAVGLAFKSEALNTYYWGVSPGEANDVFAGYTPGSGVNVKGSLRAGYHLTRSLAVSLALQYERLNDEAARSPIVRDDDVVGFFTGLSMRF